MKNPCYAQHTENDKTGQEKRRNDCKQIHDTIKGNKKTQCGAPFAYPRI